MFDADQLSRLYNSQFGFLLQHTPPGLPLLIRALDEIFQRSPQATRAIALMPAPFAIIRCNSFAEDGSGFKVCSS